MEQIAIVKKVLTNGQAQVSVERRTATGCKSVIFEKEKVVTAFNDAKANLGDIVRIRSVTPAFMKSAAIVYLLPLILSMAVYGIAAAVLSVGEGPMLLFALLGFVLGVVIAVAWDRHMKKVNGLKFKIVEIQKARSGQR